MATGLGLSFPITANLGPLKNAMSEFKNTVTGTVEGVGESVNGVQGHLTSLKSLVLGALTGYASKKLFDFTIGDAAQFEQYEQSFTVMLKSADLAKAKLQELNEYAAKTPFRLPEVVEASKMMMAFGMDTKTYLGDIGNLAAATNKPIMQVTEAFARLKSGRFGESFENFAQLGISRQMLMGEGLVFDKGGSYKGSVDQALAAVQKIVKDRFDGMTEKQGQTFNGMMSTFQDNLAEFGRGIGQKAFPAVKGALTDLMNEFSKMKTNGMLDSIGDVVGKLISGIANGIGIIVKAVVWVSDTIKDNWGTIGPIVEGLGNIVKDLLVQAFDVLRDVFEKLKPALIAVGDMIIKLFTFISENGEVVRALIVGIGTAWATWMIVAKVSLAIEALAKAFQILRLAVTMTRAAGLIPMLAAFLELNPIVLAITAAIAVLAGVGYLIYENWEPIKAFFIDLWEELCREVSMVVDFVVSCWDSFYEFIKPVLQAIADVFIMIFDGICSYIQFVITSITTFIDNFIKMIKGIFSGVADIFSGLFDLLKALFLGPLLIIFDLIKGIFTGNFTDLIADIISLGSMIINAISKILSGIWKIVTSILGFVLDTIIEIISSIPGWVIDIGKYILDKIVAFGTWVFDLVMSWGAWLQTLPGKALDLAVSIVVWMINGIASTIHGIYDWICSGFNAALDFILNLPTTVYEASCNFINWLVQGIKDNAAAIGEWVSNGFNSAIDFITSLPGRALQWGSDFIDGLVNGIKGAIGSVVDAVSDVADTIRSYLHFSVPDVGPLTDYESWMPDFVGGMAKGVKESKHLLEKEVKGMSKDIALSVKPGDVSALTTDLKLDPKDKPKDPTTEDDKQVVINFNGNYNFKDKDDIDYMLNQAALMIKRRK